MLLRLYIYLYFDCENRSVEDEAETLKRQGQRPTPLISMQSGKNRYIIIHQICISPNNKNFSELNENR